MNPVQGLHSLGQSIWLDYIQRDLIASGELEERISAGEIRGVTSNPTIFANAISTSDMYTADIRSMAQTGWEAERIFDVLSIEDIRSAAGVFLPLYEETNGGDGFVSIEVNPKLADNTKGTLREARRIWEAVNRPNVMIKIPATEAGIPAIRQAIAEGINVNVTLIFSLERYSEVMEAYLRGLETRLQLGTSLDHVASVASFFVSRIDTAVDSLLEEILREDDSRAERASALMGKVAIASSKLAYAQFKATFSGSRFEILSQHGARVQRPLWASTSTKNPDYPDTYYVDTLIGPDTVNTVPPKTLKAFRDHGTAELTLEENLSASRAHFEGVEALGISLRQVTDQLEREGVAKFSDSYISLTKSLQGRARTLRKEMGALAIDVQQTLERMKTEEVGRRLWESDVSLWTHQSSVAREIQQRLGWLTLPQEMSESVDELYAFTTEVRKAGLKRVLLLGMGGSSLAPDIFRRTLASTKGMEFQVLDSTDPASISQATRRSPVDETLFIVASKSGTTTEPLALLDYFWERACKRRGQKAGDHFVAITDPGTALESLARERGFRRIFSSPPNVGGRYSALSVFGLLPATLMGIDTRAMLRGGKRMAKACGPEREPVRNPGLYLGATLGTAALMGRDKLTLIADPALEPLADWIEQLIAESSGKQGKGILPVIGEPPGSARVYGDDRLLVYLRVDGKYDRRVRGWVRGKHPVVILENSGDPLGFGEAFFQWEAATAVACHLIGVNPFDQPDVQRAKDRTIALIKAYQKKGDLPQPKKLWQGQGITLWGSAAKSFDQKEKSLEKVLTGLMAQVEPEEHLAFLIYRKQDTATKKRLARIRRKARERFGVATTLGFGPRYLHSTGQMHKGGPDSAIYLIITAEPIKDIEIPEMGISFGILEQAQAIGDLQALQALGRRVYGVHLDKPARFRDLTEAMLVAIEQV